MTKYYIFRHGETQFSGGKAVYPEDNFSVEILPEAIPILEKMGNYLKEIKSDFNVSSEYKRCQQSTEIVAKITGNNFTTDARLNEMIGTESFEDLDKRIESFLSDINSKNYQTVVICSHGAIIAGLKNLLLDDFEESEMFDFPSTGILICIEDKKMNVVDFNVLE